MKRITLVTVAIAALFVFSANVSAQDAPDNKVTMKIWPDGAPNSSGPNARDGKFIEKIGTYNPNTNPATVDLNFERALYWVNCGAQPTDTARNILSAEGVYLMKHLQGGVKKGAFDEAAAQAKFDAWKQAKDSSKKAVAVKAEQAKRELNKARLEAEKKVNEAVAEKVAKKKAEALAAAEAAAAEAAAQEAAAEAPATEAPAEA